jgi:predicted ATPase
MAKKKSGSPIDIIGKLSAMIAARKFEPYITHIRFPKYKNLKQDTRIDFSFPVTVIVGPNGTNKSSIIRALYGCPGSNNVGNFWFSSHIDPINETSGDGRRNSFIYGFHNNYHNKNIEVIKTRIKRDDDPDYWEPSRPLVTLGMESMPDIVDGEDLDAQGRSQTRWKAIEKNVIYLDFRSMLSAYDKYFYHSEIKRNENSYKQKKKFIRDKSLLIKKAIERKSESFIYYRERVINKENLLLSDRDCKDISDILQREYASIKLIRHNLYRCDGYTCLMSSKDKVYSEAFAGSGEFSVVRLVYEFNRAPNASLVLLDEPEVSLHPGAQQRLIQFILNKVKENHHQVVISSHSPAIVRELPPSAIKVLTVNSLNGEVELIKQESLPEEAFFSLGEPIYGRKTIIVEDVLAREIVLKVIRSFGEALARQVDVKYYPGGASVMWSHYAITFSSENRDDILIVFDGDMKNETWNEVDITSLPALGKGNLENLAKLLTGTTIKVHSDGGAGGGDVAQTEEQLRAYIKWIKENVAFLPGEKTPEELIWTHMDKTGLDDIQDDCFKKRFYLLTKQVLGLSDYEDPASDDILSIQKQKLAKIEDVIFEDLKYRIKLFLS